MRKIIFIALLLLIGQRNFAQDNLTGKWSEFQYLDIVRDSITIQLSIGTPEKNILYPALLEIKDKGFSGSYELLLVKKNIRQYYISKNKFSLKETPFQLEKYLAYFNGFLEYGKDLKGVPQLTLNRMLLSPKFNDKEVKDTTLNNDSFYALFNKLQSGSIVFRKVNNDPWSDTGTYKILQPELSPAYFGIMDTMSVHNRSGTLSFLNNHDNDIISVKLNSLNIVDKVDSKKRRPEEEFVLDTGMNLICFFADEFGNRPPCSASFKLDIHQNSNTTISFASPENKDATFIVAKVIYSKADSTITTFKEGIVLDGNSQEQQNNSQQNKDASLSRQNKWIGNIITNSPEITLAIWDDAIDDGDSISLLVNNKWIVKGMRVRNNPQFFRVPLNPGNNEITFVANNLGSIPPNTSVLEIIDGKKRKSFNIETDFSKNNIMRIVYEVK